MDEIMLKGWNLGTLARYSNNILKDEIKTLPFDLIAQKATVYSHLEIH